MKALLNKMIALDHELEKLIQKREETFNNRTEAWQDSEKGFEYQERIERLTEMLDDVRDWANEIYG